PPEERQTGMRDKADGPLITVAGEAIAVPDIKRNVIQLSLHNAITHEVDKEGKSVDQQFPAGDQILPVTPPAEQRAKAFRDMPTRELTWYSKHSASWLEARIELHKRLALPLACIALALVGIPLGISSRKGGKSGGYVTAVVLAFFCYYLSFLSLLGLADQQRIPLWLAAWTPNIVFTILGIVLLLRLEKPGEKDLVGAVRMWLTMHFKTLGEKFAPAPASQGRRFALMQLVDTYVLTQFLFYFVVSLT